MTSRHLPQGINVRSLSLRDPSGCLLDTGDRLLRFVLPEAAADAIAAMRSPALRQLIETKNWISSRVVDGNEAAALIRVSPDGLAPSALWLEHPRVFFPSYPSEWSAQMLHAAADLTLEIAQRLLGEGLGLKDATPYNILFEGSRPIFVDFLSVEKRHPLDPSWLAFGQFARSFIYPLLANRELGLPLDMVFLSRRDGLEADELYRICPAWRRLTPKFLPLVTIPVWLGRRSRKKPSPFRAGFAGSEAQAKFILAGLMRHLRRTLGAVAPKAVKQSPWSNYMGDDLPYTGEEFQEKEIIVGKWLSRLGPRRALDVGCNTGHFSRLAAKHGAEVVAIDSDVGVIARLFESSRHEAPSILPLRIDFARPTPPVGWMNSETKSFLERAEGKFDCTLMLAVVHHLMTTEGIPLDDIVSAAARTTTRHLIVEYVDPRDPTFVGLSRGRERLYAWLTPDSFVSAWERAFSVRESIALRRPTRRLYLLERRP